MKILGIDFGLKKLGLAISDGKLAEPYAVVRYQNEEKLINHLKGIIKKEGIEEVIVGVSEGGMGEQSKKFGEKISEFIRTEYQDETLTTQDANNLAISSGISRKKRKSMEDAYAASLMLQDYLDR
ncbi:MAG TPA: Holliday junction resolvase RuvX [Patescibacteria group bacterium]